VFDNDTYLGNTFGLRMDNSLIYTTPNWSGFGAQVMLVMNGSCSPSDPQVPADLCKQPGSGDNRLPSNLSDGIDMWNISLSYKNGPFFFGGTYMALEGINFDVFPGTAPTWDGDQWGLAFGYNAAPFAVTLAYESGDVNTLYIGDGDNIYLTGQYTFGNNVIRGAYGFSTPDIDQFIFANGDIREQSDINNWILGYQYNFSKRTRVWVEYIGQDPDSDLVGARQTISIGTRHDF
jgi:predicted porin